VTIWYFAFDTEWPFEMTILRRSGVSALEGGGMHPDREVWVNATRDPVMTGFTPSNKWHATAS
jgi:hypothetical protein